jgi:DNA repair ATPase RecN
MNWRIGFAEIFWRSSFRSVHVLRFRECAFIFAVALLCAQGFQPTLFSQSKRLQVLGYLKSPHTRPKPFLSQPVSEDTAVSPPKSQIVSIRSTNLAGARDHDAKQGSVCINIAPGQNLVAVTGETGSGKSLLVGKVVNLLCGGKATPSLVATFEPHEDSTLYSGGIATVVEMDLLLTDPHLGATKATLERLGVNSSLLFSAATNSSCGILCLRRSLALQSLATSERAKLRLKSACSINGQSVTLKALATVAGPLLATVDAGIAANALVKTTSLMAILDTAVKPQVKTYMTQSKAKYRVCRREREVLEAELASRVLPTSYTSDSLNDVELLTHWIDEIDAFESRVMSFCKFASGLQDSNGSALETARAELATATWMENGSRRPNIFSSRLYDCIVTLRDAIRDADNQIVAAYDAIETLSSMSRSESTMSSLERARKLLFDAAQSEESPNSKISQAAEESHELLNSVESTLLNCSRFMESNFLNRLEECRQTCPCSVEAVDGLLLEWNTLARKHGIAPTTLPSCHKALQNERNGNVEALQLLPASIEQEAQAFVSFRDACELLTIERRRVAERLSEVVTDRLPCLGMEGMALQVEVSEVRRCDEPSAYGTGSVLGTNEVDFWLVSALSSANATGTNANRVVPRRSPIHTTASSGEKARILLAIECALPGSIGAMIDGSASNAAAAGDESDDDIEQRFSNQSPVAVIYDEIDAHVGGNAAVAVANMLAIQSSQSSQVFCITHSASVAATADLHIVIQSVGDKTNEKGYNGVKALTVEGIARRKELARMASGNLAKAEAEIFADALLRAGAESRRSVEG